jgi:hypothetical protein
LPNEEYTELFGISKKLSKDPYCDIRANIANLGKTNSLDVQNLLHIFSYLYERQQAAYLSKLYSRMKLATLKAYIGNDTDIEQYLAKYSWRLDNGVISTAYVPYIVGIHDVKEEIKFQNKMTLYLENITRADAILKVPKETK